MDREKLRIAILAPISWRCPPRAYGPWELVASNLAEGLVEQGMEVALFASGDSLTRARLISVVPKPLNEWEGEPPNIRLKEEEHIKECIKRARAGEFDLLHNHLHCHALSYVDDLKIPVVSTLHGSAWVPAQREFLLKMREYPYISLSDAERTLCPELNWVRTIYNGIRLEDFPFYGGPREDYLLFAGRIAPEKGAREAVELARRAGMKLLFAGMIEDKYRDYYQKYIEPYLGGQIQYLGMLTPRQLVPYYQKAKAVLFLINWCEPFGLVAAEALACGTPLIAFKQGAMVEIIESGRNGFLCDDLDQAVEAVKRLDEIDPRECRKVVEEKFSQKVMVERHLELYYDLVYARVPHPASELQRITPWGRWLVLEDKPNWKVKRIQLKPGHRLSYQKHFKRREHWMIVQGTALVILDGKEIRLKAGESIDIPQGSAHRIGNPGTGLLTFIEIQQGEYFGEDDIIRLEDDYGRA